MARFSDYSDQGKNLKENGNWESKRENHAFAATYFPPGRLYFDGVSSSSKLIPRGYHARYLWLDHSLRCVDYFSNEKFSCVSGTPLF